MAIKKNIGKLNIKSSYAYLIEKKCEGDEFTEEEVRNIVDSILDDEMPDYQLAALIMAIFFKDMSAQETSYFADEMIGTGETLDLSNNSKPKVAKYSTGGVGDKTTMILSAIGAAAVARLLLMVLPAPPAGCPAAVTLACHMGLDLVFFAAFLRATGGVDGELSGWIRRSIRVHSK